MSYPPIPYLLLDDRIAKRNIRSLSSRLKAAGIDFHPHFKTHQSAAVAEWFRPFTRSITVSSTGMAAYFKSHHWDEILIAFPLSVSDIEYVTNHGLSGPGFAYLVDGPLLPEISACFKGSETGFYIEVDCGYSRSGIAWNDSKRLRATLRSLDENGMPFRGVYSHFGEMYGITKPADRIPVLKERMARLTAARDIVGNENTPMSVGDTPSAGMTDLLQGVTSFHAGNFVFNDMQQLALSSCSLEDIAVSLITEIVSVYPGRDECLLRAGSVHLSRDSYTTGAGSKAESQSYGEVFALKNGLPDLDRNLGFLRSVSQEHGVMRCTGALPQPGERVAVLPAHSCLCVSNFNRYYLPDGQYIEKYTADR